MGSEGSWSTVFVVFLKELNKPEIHNSNGSTTPKGFHQIVGGGHASPFRPHPPDTPQRRLCLTPPRCGFGSFSHRLPLFRFCQGRCRFVLNLLQHVLPQREPKRSLARLHHRHDGFRRLFWIPRLPTVHLLQQRPKLATRGLIVRNPPLSTFQCGDETRLYKEARRSETSAYSLSCRATRWKNSRAFCTLPALSYKSPNTYHCFK